MEDLGQRARSAIENAVTDRPEGEQLFVQAYVQRVLADVDRQHPEQTLALLQEENKRLKALKAATISAADNSPAGGKAREAAREPPEPSEPYVIGEPKAAPPTEALASPPEDQAQPPARPLGQPFEPQTEPQPEPQLEEEMICFPPERSLLEAPSNARFRFAIVGFTVPGGALVNTDHDKTGKRYDSTALANGIIRAGGGVSFVEYVPEDIDFLEAHLQHHDAIIFRLDKESVNEAGITTSPLSQLMDALVAQGKSVWSPFSVCAALADEGNLAKVAHMWCGLKDTFAYSTLEAMDQGFRQTAAFKPRVIMDSNSEEIWHCSLLDREYCATFGEARLEDWDMLKVVDVNDQEEEHLTVAEFLAFCDQGLEGLGDVAARDWRSAAVGAYFDEDTASSLTYDRRPRVVDLRHRPNGRTSLRFLVARDEVCATIVQQTMQATTAGSSTGSQPQTQSSVQYVLPKTPQEAPEHRSLREHFEQDLPALMEALGVSEGALPLLWSCDFEVVDGSFVVTQFNGSCVELSMLEAACGSDSDLLKVSNQDFLLGMGVVDTIGRKAMDFLEKTRPRRGLQASAPSLAIPGPSGQGGGYDFNGAIPEEEEGLPS